VNSQEKILAMKIFSRFKEDQTEDELDRAIMRFKNETSLHFNYTHENLVKAIDSGEKEYQHNEKTYSIPFYVMPKAKSNLKDYFVSNKVKNRSDEIRRIFIEILDGLICLHENECYHRDLKPQNILVLEDNDKIVIADFGIAHFTEKYKEISIVTDPEDRLKNNKYWAPDQGSSDEDYRIDIYA